MLFFKQALNELKTWVETHNIPCTIFLLSHWSRRVISSLELCELTLEIIDRQLTTKQKQLTVFDGLAWYYEWYEPDGEKKSTIPQQLKRVFEKVLANYANLKDYQYYLLKLLYGFVFKAEMIEEDHMANLYEIVKNDLDFAPERYFYQNMPEDILRFLLAMLNSKDLRVARLAAASLNGVYEILERRGKEEWISEMAVCEKLWELAKNEEDLWQPRYIANMAQFKLKWSEYAEEWFEAMKNAHTGKHQLAWGKVIEESSYVSDKDRDILYALLLRILESQNDFVEPIYTSTFKRLHKIIYEVEILEFEEASLNLPLKWF
jgi:hypothetical protein